LSFQVLFGMLQVKKNRTSLIPTRRSSSNFSITHNIYLCFVLPFLFNWSII
jgi:hypothetical protein